MTTPRKKTTALAADACPRCGTTMKEARGVLRLRVNLAWPARRTDPATGRPGTDALGIGARALPAGRLVVAMSDPFRAR